VNRHDDRPGTSVLPPITVPVVVGILKPTILWPSSLASGLAPDQIEAILLHELAHIRRFDLAVNLLQRIVEALLPSRSLVRQPSSQSRARALLRRLCIVVWLPANELRRRTDSDGGGLRRETRSNDSLAAWRSGGGRR